MRALSLVIEFSTRSAPHGVEILIALERASLYRLSRSNSLPASPIAPFPTAAADTSTSHHAARWRAKPTGVAAVPGWSSVVGAGAGVIVACAASPHRTGLVHSCFVAGAHGSGPASGSLNGVVAEVEGWEAGGRSGKAGWKSAEVEGHSGQVEAARSAGWHVRVVDGEVAVRVCVGAGWRDV